MIQLIVEDTPPSKLARRSSKDIRTQETLNVDGFSNRDTRSGGAPRGIKAKYPRLRKPRDENEGEIRETAYRASLNGIKIGVGIK
ncbi:hypothetical protein RHGRI_027795 [Rhododendron griersonianum]|uniref:Uncharacterized protein n=1 Tax=Rhododendron griersonianum TaxID=479676 RepID=A0AAV6IXZ6_9ERIC|nr:hypothetical protein RHGRI_027795 [Rhododendron griersonianum]